MLVDNWETEKTVRNGWERVCCGEDNRAKIAMRGHYWNCINVPGRKSEKDKYGNDGKDLKSYRSD